ncbi:MAG TPA: glycosyltransferase family 1 protein [Acidimicrobiales bacterium]
MRVVIDALPMRGDSLSVVVEHMLEGWVQINPDDDLHIVVGPDPQCEIPPSVTVHPVPFGRIGFASRVRAQTVLIPRLCRDLQADVMLGVLPATSIAKLPCPRAIIVYDLLYKLHPEQFSRQALLLRRLSYAIGFAQADAMVCISERTRRDLLELMPKLRRRPVEVALLGADHVDSWPATPVETPYAVAFGRYLHKNVALLLDAWAILHQRGSRLLPLALLGVSGSQRTAVDELIAQRGLTDVVRVSPWLPIEEFRGVFASSSLVVFPSEFEGFGLPAAEAMRRGIPVVVSSDPALLEITAGHATVMEQNTPEALVEAVEAAMARSAASLEAARVHADRFTWKNFANVTRRQLAGLT